MFLKLFKKIKRELIPSGLKGFIRRLIKPRFFYFIFNSTNPVSEYYGLDRGRPIDRFYIEDFLEKNKEHIKGNCLEVLNNDYTEKYGGDDVIKSDILDIDKNNKKATIIDDLRSLKNISDETYDCVILTQVLQFIDDLDSVISACHRILKKNGILLATLPAISRIDCVSGIEGDFWRFTQASARFLFEKKFEPSELEISSRGNVKAGTYFYTGFSQEDISSKILIEDDGNFPVLITVKAKKDGKNF